MEVVDKKTTPLKHPYMDDVLVPRLFKAKKLLECLEIRKTYLEKLTGFNPGDDTKEKYQHNEYLIEIIETDGRIASQKNLIAERERYNVQFMKQFVIDIQDCDKFYDAALAKAKAMATSNKRIREELAATKWENIDTNLEVKIAFFKRLVNLIK